MILFIDGASRGNPGQAGIGFILFDNKDNIILQQAYLINDSTNNIAEYASLLVALYTIKKNNITKSLIIKSDSLLLVNQCNKLYKIKNKNLKIAYDLLIRNFFDIDMTFIHIKREFNFYADKLANRGIDEKIKLPKDIDCFVNIIFS